MPINWWETWQIAVPVAFGVGLVLIVLSLWADRRRDQRRWGPISHDTRNWQGLVMKDFKTTPRSWR